MKFDQRYNLDDLAKLLGVSIHVKPGIEPRDIVISGVATIEAAAAGDITFLINDIYTKHLPNTKATAIILPKHASEVCELPALVAANPKLSLAKLLQLGVHSRIHNSALTVANGVSYIHPSSIVGDGCTLAEGISIGPNCVLGDRVIIESGVVIEANSVIGNDCHLQRNSCLRANVTLYDWVCIGEDTTIHSSTVIGSDGFGYANDANKWIKMPHVGGVKIGSKVEIGSNVSIDRGFLEDTVIADGVIIDNLVQIGHNVRIGENTAIAGCAAIAGSAVIGKNCLLGGAVRIIGHITIEDGTVITAASSVNRSLKKGVYSSGIPAKESTKWRRNLARFNNLDEIAKRLSKLEHKFKDPGI